MFALESSKLLLKLLLGDPVTFFVKLMSFIGDCTFCWLDWILLLMPLVDVSMADSPSLPTLNLGAETTFVACCWYEVTLVVVLFVATAPPFCTGVSVLYAEGIIDSSVSVAECRITFLFPGEPDSLTAEFTFIIIWFWVEGRGYDGLFSGYPRADLPWRTGYMFLFIKDVPFCARPVVVYLRADYWMG